MNRIFALLLFLTSLSSMGSTLRQLTAQEINLANWISRCPNEYTELSKLSDKISSGSFFMDHIGQGFTFYFQKENTAIGSLQIARFMAKPGFTCKLFKN